MIVIITMNSFILSRPPLTPEQIAHVPPVEHPCVITHPVTGRQAVYIVEHFVSHIGDLNEEDSQILVKEVIEFVTHHNLSMAINGKKATSYCGTIDARCIRQRNMTMINTTGCCIGLKS